MLGSVSERHRPSPVNHHEGTVSHHALVRGDRDHGGGRGSETIDVCGDRAAVFLHGRCHRAGCEHISAGGVDTERDRAGHARERLRKLYGRDAAEIFGFQFARNDHVIDENRVPFRLERAFARVGDVQVKELVPHDFLPFFGAGFGAGGSAGSVGSSAGAGAGVGAAGAAMPLNSSPSG